MHDELEALTDRIALPAYDVLDDDEIEELQAALTPLARTIVAHGDIPKATPIGASPTPSTDERRRFEC